MIEINKHLYLYPQKAQVSRTTLLKKSGKPRTIYEPSKELKKWLQKLLRLLEKEKNSFDPRIFSVKNKSCIDFARQHLKSDYMLVLDISDYYSNISPSLAEKVLIRTVDEDALANEIVKRCFWDGMLPQGFPTSTFIANLVSEEIICGLFDKLTEKDYTCGIYVDDVVISSNADFDYKDVTDIVGRHINKYGFSLNSKTKYFSSNRLKEMVGLRLIKKDNRIIISNQTWELLYAGIKSGKIGDTQIAGWISYIGSLDKVKTRRLEKILAAKSQEVS